MYWDRLPPQTITDCRYRHGNNGSQATCRLLTEAGVPQDSSFVTEETCTACLSQFPPAAECWNTVIASLIYARTTELLEQTPANSTLLRLRDRAAERLAFLEATTSHLDVLSPQRPRADSLRELLTPLEPCRCARVKSWAVGVVSSPRRQPTLEQTLDSLVRAGWETPLLFLDGTMRIAERFAHLPGVLREPRVGCWSNYYLALAELVMRYPDADAYLVAEDDALFYDREPLRAYLEEMLWPERRPCLISLYCPGPYAAPTYGWRPFTGRWGLGAVAFIFPRRVAQSFLLDRSVCAHRWNRWQEEDRGLTNTDLVIGAWAQRKRIRIWYPTPSLVQHIGTTSTLQPHLETTGERRADEWVGNLVRQRS